MLLKITESLPRKSAVSPVYNSPPNRRKENREMSWGEGGDGKNIELQEDELEGRNPTKA